MQEDKIASRDTLSELFESTINELDKKSKKFNPISFINPSTVTECPRRLTYRLLATEEEKKTSYLSNLHDVFIRKKWVDFFRKCNRVKVLAEDVPAADCHYNLNGKADVVIRFEDNQFVVQIHSVSNETWLNIQEKGAHRKDVIEAIIYLWLLEITDALILYENKDTGEYCVFHAQQYQPIIEAVRKKCLVLMEHKEKGGLCNKPNKYTQASIECKFCEYKNNC
jgi:hypothetical protein